MEQTASKEFGAIQDITDPPGEGHVIRCTEQPTTAANAGSASAFTFENVFPSVEGEIDGSGGDSMFSVSFSGKVVPSELSALPDASNSISFYT